MIKLSSIIREIVSKKLLYGAWMDKDSNVYIINDYMGHESFALQYCRNNHIDFGNDLYPTITKVYAKMYELGFIRIIFQNFNPPVLLYSYNKDIPPSKKQLKELIDTAIKHHINIIIDGVFNKEYPLNESIKKINENFDLSVGKSIDLDDRFYLKNHGDGRFKAYEKSTNKMAMTIHVYVHDGIPSVSNVEVMDEFRGNGLYRKTLPFIKQLFGNVRSSRYGETSPEAEKAWKSVGATDLTVNRKPYGNNGIHGLSKYMLDESDDTIIQNADGELQYYYKNNMVNVWQAKATKPRNGFFTRALGELKSRGINTIRINMQSLAMQNTLASLVKRGILINPREPTGSSTAEYFTVFDIV